MISHQPILAPPERTSPANEPCPGKANVLILVDEFCCNGAGTEQHIHFLLRKLPRDRLGVHFVVLTRIHAQDLSLLNINPHFLRDGTRPGVAGMGQRLYRLRSYIRQHQIDVVHAFSLVSEIYAVLATGLAGRGRVLGVRRNTGYWHTWWTLWLQRVLNLLGPSYVANCDAARTFAVEQEWVPARRCAVIRNPVCLDRLQEGNRQLRSRASLGIKEGEKVVGIVATVRPIKDHATFLRAAALVLQEHPETRFLIVGWADENMTSILTSLIQDLCIERQVTWVGAVDNVFSVLPHFDVAVLASSSEGFSNALLEYATAGLASVATDVGGSREIVQHGETGFLVPAAACELMGQRIGQLLHDDALRERFGHHARQWVDQQFSEQSVLAQYLRLYSALANHDER